MIESVKLTLRGRDVTVRPLTLGQMQRFETEIAAISDATSPLPHTQKMAHLLPLLAESMGLDVDTAGEILDISNFLNVWKALMNVSGINQAPEGEAQPVPAIN